MKQLGIVLFVFAATGVTTVLFGLQGRVWELLFGLLIIRSTAFIPEFKQLAGWKMHWRIALTSAFFARLVWSVG